LVSIQQGHQTTFIHVFYSDFKQKCISFYAAGGDDAFDAGAYDRAIELYSVAIDLDPTADTIFASRCKAKMRKMLWEQALDDAEKVLHYLSVRSSGS